jgi:8-oxo-dGTP pyrophosphatase MutT (NUDIX family)
MNEQYHRIGKDGRKYWGKMGAGIVFTDGKKILLLKRNQPGDHYGAWTVPGGKAERGENPIDAARREAQEECGHVEGYRFAHFDDLDGRHHFHTFLFAIDRPFKVMISDEHSDFNWFDLDAVMQAKLHPRFRSLFPSIRRKIDGHFAKSFGEYVEKRDAIPGE